MKSARKNHPGERFFIRRDAISEEESFLEENFCRQGCNQRGRIIPGREFLSAGMQLARKNHPWERIFVGRDEIGEGESSLGENFCRQGCNQRGRIIPERDFLLAGMKSARKNHPRKRILIGRDEISIAEGIAFSELPSGEISNPATFRIDPKGHWRAVISRIKCRAGLTEQSSEWEKGRLSEAFCRPGESGAEGRKQEWF